MMSEIRLAFRQLLRQPGFTAVVVLTLGIGFALTASVFATVNAYLLRSMPYPASERIYHVMYAPAGPWEPRGMNAIDWKSLGDAVEDTIVSSGQTLYLEDNGSLTAVSARQVSSGFLRGLGVRAVLGRTFTEAEFEAGGPGVVMIGHALWRDRFGSDPQVVGKTFRATSDESAESAESLSIVGVLPPGFWHGRDSTALVDVLKPLRTLFRPYMVRLREGVPVALAEKRMTEAARSVGSDFRPEWTGVHLQSVHARYVENVRPLLVGVTIAVGVVLVLVCANAAVLILLRALRRQTEVIVRMALGAERKHLFRMLSAEALLLCAAAVSLGLVLTAISLRTLSPLMETQLGRPAPAGPATIELDRTVILVLAGVSLLVAFAFAWIPLLAPMRDRVAGALSSQSGRLSDGRILRRIRSGLIVFEVAGSFVLLVGCGLMIRSAINLLQTDLGFDAERVLRVGVRLPANSYREASALQSFYSTLAEALPRDPGSKVALMSSFPPFYPANTQPYEAAQARVGGNPVGVMRVGAGYFDLFGVAIRQGREFRSADRPGSDSVVVISQTLAQQLWPEGGAIGRQLRVIEGDILAVLGIYGVTAFVTLQRRREIGIRVALGAPRESIIRMFLAEGARVVAVGIGLGLLGAKGAVRILESQVYGIQPFDVATVVLAVMVMAAAGLGTIWWPARRAVQGDPIAALRTE